MKLPRLNFIRLHYTYILLLSVLAVIVIYPAQNLSGIDAFFTSCSAATTTGLNTVDVNKMRTFQQVVIYVVPLIGNLSVINLAVVLVRLYWFETRFKDIVRLSRQRLLDRPRSNRLQSSESGGRDSITLRNRLSAARIRDIRVLRPEPRIGSSRTAASESEGLRLRARILSRIPNNNANSESDSRIGTVPNENENENAKSCTVEIDDSTTSTSTPNPPASPSDPTPVTIDRTSASLKKNSIERSAPPAHISFSAETNMEPRGRALRIPGPREFESGQTVREVDDDDLAKSITIEEPPMAGPSGENERRRLPTMGRLLSHAVSVERAASNAFILGNSSRKRSRSRSSNPLNRSSSRADRVPLGMPYLSYQPTIGRNSRFLGLTDDQRDELGGIEYRSLKLLAKIVFSYYVFWHVFGVVCLIGWIYNSDRKYRDYIQSVGQSPTWWAIFSGMTTYNNLGFTLTPDSMTSFRNATFPIFIMTFLMYIGNTGYPCMLRLVIWLMFKISPRGSAIREPLNFLLDHPRRCYTLLFPSSPTWMLFFSLVFLNFIDVLLFLVLDLHNEEVLAVPSSWNRFLAAVFQAASARTTGTCTFNVSKVHPAVQFMLMVMMYISVFPIAISVRKTNTYEENSLGLYDPQSDEIDESNSTASYVGAHVKKQLAFDLWYVFFGMFLLMITEGSKLADKADPDFAIFSIFFEAVSAYGNVGLSLGHPSINSGLSTKFSVLGKLVICALMLRGRHRGLPYELDRAIILPSERNLTESSATKDGGPVTTTQTSTNVTIGSLLRSRVAEIV
ncbi:low-affinity potassium transporter [Histoplasma ohiense]|nr:low-affinity potassium transporter [Histoplasma ohiense (nom. inval.)]